MQTLGYVGAVKAWVHAPIFAAFGINVWTVRLPSILLAAVTILFLGMFVRAQLGTAWAALLLALLATDPVILNHARLDWGPHVIAAFMRVLALIALWRWLTTGAKRWLIILCAAFLVGFLDKLNFLWVIAAWTAAAAIVCGRLALMRLRARPAVAAADRRRHAGAARLGHDHARPARGAARHPRRRRNADARPASGEGVEPVCRDLQRDVGHSVGVRRGDAGHEGVQLSSCSCSSLRRFLLLGVVAAMDPGAALPRLPHRRDGVPRHRHRGHEAGRRLAPPRHAVADARAAPRHAARDHDATSWHRARQSDGVARHARDGRSHRVGCAPRVEHRDGHPLRRRVEERPRLPSAVRSGDRQARPPPRGASASSA